MPRALHASCREMNASEIPASSPEDPGDWSSPGHIHSLVLMAVTLGALYLCYRMALPFLPALAWALAFALLLVPMQRWLEPKLRSPGIAAGVLVLLAGVGVLFPAMLVADRLVDEVARGGGAITGMLESGQWRRNVSAYPLLAPAADWVEAQFDLPETANAMTAWLTGFVASLARESLLQVIGMVLTLYLLFYFLRDRRTILASIAALSPLSRADTMRLFGDVDDTVHATVYGTLVVAMVQGTLGGLMFWWLGLPAPLLWGVLMGVLAIVPVLGAFIVWIPAALFLLLDGSGGKALLLALWGAVVVGGIDNLLYPMLVGRRLKMHTLLAFVSIVGGLAVFGSAGLILGPVVFAITRLLLEIWNRRGERLAASGHAAEPVPPGDAP
jgi:predicted PurR-regulated permease PerM